jgi:hypothetical protein
VPAERDLFSLACLQSEEEQIADAWRTRERYGEAFWRAHHQAWRQSDLNQREYREAPDFNRRIRSQSLGDTADFGTYKLAQQNLKQST